LLASIYRYQTQDGFSAQRSASQDFFEKLESHFETVDVVVLLVSHESGYPAVLPDRWPDDHKIAVPARIYT
jgi:hypothetical protein